MDGIAWNKPILKYLTAGEKIGEKNKQHNTLIHQLYDYLLAMFWCHFLLRSQQTPINCRWMHAIVAEYQSTNLLVRCYAMWCVCVFYSVVIEFLSRSIKHTVQILNASKVLQRLLWCFFSFFVSSIVLDWQSSSNTFCFFSFWSHAFYLHRYTFIAYIYIELLHLFSNRFRSQQ